MYYFQRLREVIYLNDHGVVQLAGEVEVDESYFGCARKGKVSAVMIPNAKTKALMPIICEKVAPDSIVYSTWL